jgi:hypothetical protein
VNFAPENFPVRLFFQSKIFSIIFMVPEIIPAQSILEEYFHIIALQPEIFPVHTLVSQEKNFRTTKLCREKFGSGSG